MKKAIYAKHLGIDDLESIVQMFHDTIIDTNRGHKFFVDWGKVQRHVESYKVECNILNSLIGSKNFDVELKDLLSEYPNVLPVIPILIAVRDLKLQVINDFLDADSDIVRYNFSERTLLPQEIDEIVDFFNKTGLKSFFENMATRSVYDYLTGVEVGMDTHARKNRSGEAMELVLKPIIEAINSRREKPFEVLFQQNFGSLISKFGIPVSSSIENRKADFIIVDEVSKQVINIEVNFFSGTGSKPQEIVDSYINRQGELAENGFKFIWVTDGYGWKGQKNQIKKGFEKVDYLLNLHFVRQGLLEAILIALK